MSYHVSRNGQQLGQYEQDAVIAQIRDGQLLPEDLGWTEGMAEWQPLKQIFPDEFPVAAAASDMPAVPATPVGGAAPAGQAASSVKIETYLTQSILVTLCCCLPFGVVAIVYSSQVNTKLAAGDVAGAQKASDNAKMWGWIGFGCGLVIVGLNFIVGFMQGMQGNQPGF